MKGSLFCWLGLSALVLSACGSDNGGHKEQCGNSVIDQFEACDGANLNGLSCEDLDFAGGTLACNAECQFDTSGCVNLCGNEQIDPGESCDGENLDGKDCTDLGYDTGTLLCDVDCSFDSSGCENLELCGNGSIDPDEDCDGSELGGQTCQDLGYTGGALACDSACAFDASGCEGFTPCGNGQIDSGEECDGEELNGTACTDLGFWSGVLTCGQDCRFDLAGCMYRCGNSFVDDGEDCDGAILNGKDCIDLGYTGGNLACEPECLFDTEGCEGDDPCGNGEINYGEDCDGDNLNEKSCETLGYFTGDLTCDWGCHFDESLCTNCGNGTIESGEACDGAELGGLECTDLGYSGGELACAAGCLFEVSSCAGCTDDSYEENDDQQSAAPLIVGDHQLVICNELGAETDWFSVELLAGDTLVVVAEFNASLLDLDLELLSLGGELLDSSTSTSGREEMLYSAPDAQTVYLRAYPYDDQAGVLAYVLHVLKNPPCLEHGDCPAGQLCQDYACVDFACDDQNPCPPGLVCSNLACVQCRSSADCPSPVYFRCEDNACVFACQQDMFEPNDEATAPAAIGIDFAEVALTLCGEFDQDWYQVELMEDQHYAFSISFLHADGDIDLELYRASDPDLPLASGLSVTDNEGFLYAVPEGSAGPHLVRVFLASAGAYGQTYDMSVIAEEAPECTVDGDCPPGQLCVEHSCVDAPPGDMCANPIVVGSYPYQVTGVDISGFTPQLEMESNACTNYNTAGRDVIYQLSLGQGRQLEAALTSTFDGALYLVDDCSAVPIPQSSCLAGVDAQAQGQTEVLTYTAQSEVTLYLVVDHYSAGGPDSGSFDLELTLQ